MKPVYSSSNWKKKEEAIELTLQLLQTLYQMAQEVHRKQEAKMCRQEKKRKI